MSALLTMTNTGALLAGSAPTTGQGLADALRNFIAPLFLFGISVFALTFLARRQMTQFAQFAAIAVGVAVFFYAPGIVENLAKMLATTVGG